MKVVNVDSYNNIDGVEYVRLSEAREKLESLPNEPVVWVTPPHDYGLCYQGEHPIAIDRKKDFALNFEAYAQELGEGTGMDPVYFTPRCNVEFCKLTDEYSVKIDTWTHCTLDLEIPTNLTWFMANCNVSHPRIHPLPFGVNSPDPDNTFSLPKLCMGGVVLPSMAKLYLNFSEHTFQRRMLNLRFQNVDWATVVTKEDANGPASISHEEYINDLEMHRWVLCPPGVGLDSFRVWETLFCGNFPVMERDHWNNWMDGVLPVILLDSFEELYEDGLELLYSRDEELMKQDFDVDTLISEEYWRGVIENAVRQ